MRLPPGHRRPAVPPTAAAGPARRGARPGPTSRRAAPSRPGQRRTGAAPSRGGTRADGAGRRRGPGGLTGRAAVLGLVVCALALSLAYPLKEYLAERSQIAALQRQRTAAEQSVAALEARKRQLSDPAYLRAQARKRLQYVTPGDSLYVVVTPSPTGGAAPSPSSSPQPTVVGGGPWYGRLWGTVRSADGASAP